MSEDTNKQIRELLAQLDERLTSKIDQLSQDVAPLKNVDFRLLMRRVDFLTNDVASMRDELNLGANRDLYLKRAVSRLEDSQKANFESILNQLRIMQSHGDRMNDRVRELQNKPDPVNKLPALPSAAGPEEEKPTTTKRFTLEVTMDTAAFDEGRRAELARILNDVSGEAATGIEGGDRPLRDSDGNVVGRYTGMPD